MSVRTFSCLCGGIKGEVRGDPVFKNLCHCISCQKQTGSVYGMFAAFKSEQVTFTESEPSLMKTYDDTTPESGTVIKRSFCGRCGGTIKAAREVMPDIVILAVGIIDGDRTAFRPDVELYCRNRPDWLEAVEGTKQFTAMPTSQ